VPGRSVGSQIPSFLILSRIVAATEKKVVASVGRGRIRRDTAAAAVVIVVAVVQRGADLAIAIAADAVIFYRPRSRGRGSRWFKVCRKERGSICVCRSL
jgi:hypothetical protein